MSQANQVEHEKDHRPKHLKNWPPWSFSRANQKRSGSAFMNLHLTPATCPKQHSIPTVCTKWRRLSFWREHDKKGFLSQGCPTVAIQHLVL